MDIRSFEEIIELYCEATDQTYLLGRHIDNTILDEEQIIVCGWYYGKPDKETTRWFLNVQSYTTNKLIEWKEN